MTFLPFVALIPPQDPSRPTSATVTGNVLRPAMRAPTPELLEGLKAPEGFRIAPWAEGLENPRIVKVRPDGTVYITQRKAENVVMLRDTDGDGMADLQKEVMKAQDLHGLDFTKDGKWAFVIGIHKVWKAPVLTDGTFGPAKQIINGLPDAGQHPNRTLAVGPDNRLYISIGSTTNAAPERNPYNATMVVTDLEGKGKSIYASGLRNTIGFDWSPKGQLYGWDHGSDWKGDDECREEINAIAQGKRYGWPFVYEDGKYDPEHMPLEKGYTLERWREESTSPEATYTAHAAGMQLQFYRGAMFPKEYQGDAFVTLHGSWNRYPASGYEVVRVRFGEDGKPKAVEPFITGWVLNAFSRREAQRFGRPCGLATMPDGSLLIGDDDQGMLYRVSYAKEGQRAMRLRPLDTTTVSPNLVRSPKQIDLKLGGWGLPNSEYAPGRSKSPAISLGDLPPGTKTLAVIMEDPDATAPKPFVHWLMADLTLTKEIPANVLPGDETAFGVTSQPTPNTMISTIVRYGGVQGGNSHGTVAYYGPKPPVGDSPHRYHFTVYALDAKLGLKPGFNRVGLLKAMQGHVLGQGTTIARFGK
ncbi:YbhB/YbcL family Raf kinase inhibitor-like protein [bacterium]|nr:MAG: YbhB/YbcL family Raf kinase inhibitor-like protein [bacterium]